MVLHMRYYTFDSIGLIFGLGCILLMVGVIPFTPATVGALLILSQVHMQFRWKAA